MTAKDILKSRFPQEWAALLAKHPGEFDAWVDGWIAATEAELEFSDSLSTLQENIVADGAAMDLIDSAISLYREDVLNVDADGTKVELQNKIKSLQAQQTTVFRSFQRRYHMHLKQQASGGAPVQKVG